MCVSNMHELGDKDVFYHAVVCGLDLNRLFWRQMLSWPPPINLNDWKMFLKVALIRSRILPRANIRIRNGGIPYLNFCFQALPMLILDHSFLLLKKSSLQITSPLRKTKPNKQKQITFPKCPISLKNKMNNMCKTTN